MRGLVLSAFVATTYPVTRLQVLIARIAKTAEIDVLAHRRLHPVPHPIVLVPRFDRAPGGKRAPFLSAQRLLLANTNDTVDYLELLGAMRAHSKDLVSDACQFWCRLLFHCLLNHDDLNLRKLSFLYAGMHNPNVKRARELLDA